MGGGFMLDSGFRAEPEMDEEQLIGLLERLADGRGGDGFARFSALHARVREREQHLFNAAGADPKFPPPFEQAKPWQSDIARRTWSELRIRLREHPLRVHVEPPNDRAASRRAANDLERVLEHGLVLADERSNGGLQGELAYGQVCLCYAVLHWQRASEQLPPFPEADVREEAPLEPRRRVHYRAAADGGARRWVETMESRRERDRRNKAEAGFPWRIEAVRPDQFAFIEDRLSPNGIGVAAVQREIGLLEYRDALLRQDDLDLRLDAGAGGAPRLAIGAAGDAPGAGAPSAGDWGERVRVASIWTRGRYYELAAPAQRGPGRWTVVKRQAHPYEMPPFAIAHGDVNDHPDPVYRWEPVLEGVYRVKPLFDYDRSLGRFLADQAVMPRYWIKLESGAYQTDNEGVRIELTGEAALAQALPAGASLQKIEFHLDPAFVEFLRLSAEDARAAAPDTGAILRGEAGPNTQPHTLNLLLSSRNAQVQHLKREQARAVRVMLRNMAMVMSKPAAEGGFGEPVWVFACTRDGRLLRDSVVGVDPAAIPSLDIDVIIDPYSQAQRIAVQEHRRARLNDPLDPLDQRGYLEQYIGDEHPEAALARYRDWQLRQAAHERALAEVAGRPADGERPPPVVAPPQTSLAALPKLESGAGSI